VYKGVLIVDSLTFYLLNEKLRKKLEVLKGLVGDFDNYVVLSDLVDDVAFCGSHYIVDENGNYLGGAAKEKRFKEIGSLINRYFLNLIKELQAKSKEETEIYFFEFILYNKGFMDLCYEVLLLKSMNNNKVASLKCYVA
jgi:hypothetical protein